MIEAVSKHFNIPKKHLLALKPATRDGVMRFVDTRDGYVYCYNKLEKRFIEGFQDKLTRSPFVSIIPMRRPSPMKKSPRKVFRLPKSKKTYY